LPQKIFCKDCGTVLYSGEEIESPTNIIQKYNSLCPNCKKKLSFDPMNIRILSLEVKNPIRKKSTRSKTKR
jgi:DNA-directed RNA polymerase subunit M/transcription elongation factor TFIIS